MSGENTLQNGLIDIKKIKPKDYRSECKFCGAKLKHEKSGHQQFCDRNCYMQFKRKESEQRVYPKCKACGKDIKEKSHKKGGIKKYCSVECYRKDNNLKEYKYVECQYCRKIFKEQRDEANLFCSKQCCNKYTSQKNAIRLNDTKQKEDLNGEHQKQLRKLYDEKLKELEGIQYRIEHEKYCVVCGEFFVGRYSHQITCSNKCAKRYQNQKHDKRNARNGKPDLSISLNRLYERDNGICKICGKKIYFTDNPNDNNYPSIDHIIPLAKGGLHQWDNVQLACRICNTIKRDKEAI